MEEVERDAEQLRLAAEQAINVEIIPKVIEKLTGLWQQRNPDPEHTDLDREPDHSLMLAISILGSLAPKGATSTPESSGNTKPGTPNKPISWLVDRTKERLGSSTLFVGAPHKKF
jgi:hypothetical protein